MGVVIPFELHGRASNGSRTTRREASSVRRSGVTPPALPVSESTIACHHSGGMLSRWSHLRAEATVAPMSSAKAPGDRHKAITARNELRAMDVSVTNPSLGQSVLKGKAEMSYDISPDFREPAGMTRMTETEEDLAYIRRVRTAREAKFDTQKPVYKYLGVPQDQYKHWETQRPMPRRYIMKFCEVCEIAPEWLLSGEGNGPAVPEYPKDIPTRSAPPRKARRARQAA